MSYAHPVVGIIPSLDLSIQTEAAHCTHYLTLALLFSPRLCAMTPLMHFWNLPRYLLSDCQFKADPKLKAHPTPFSFSHPTFVPALSILSPPVLGSPPPLSTGNSHRVGAPDGPCPTGFERVNGSCEGELGRVGKGLGIGVVLAGSH